VLSPPPTKNRNKKEDFFDNFRCAELEEYPQKRFELSETKRETILK